MHRIPLRPCHRGDPPAIRAESFELIGVVYAELPVGKRGVDGIFKPVHAFFIRYIPEIEPFIRVLIRKQRAVPAIYERLPVVVGALVPRPGVEYVAGRRGVGMARDSARLAYPNLVGAGCPASGSRGAASRRASAAEPAVTLRDSGDGVSSAFAREPHRSPRRCRTVN